MKPAIRRAALLALALAAGGAGLEARAEEELFACGAKIREGEPEKFRCLASAGNAALDAKAEAQARHLNGFMRYSAKVCFVEDNPPNAWSRNDGKIFIGRNLIRDEFERFGNVALLGVLAHEWAHQWQFEEKSYRTQPGVVSELQADCYAGYHLGRFGKIDESEMTGFARSLFEKGDYAFNSPTHHGTPEARLKVMRAGFRKGQEKATGMSRALRDCLAEAEAARKQGKREGKGVGAYRGP